jgi:hypothetical protein
VLDQVAQPVGDGIEGLAAEAPRMVGSDGEGATGNQQTAEGIAVVGGAQPGWGQGPERARRERQIVTLPGARREGERPAAAVDDGVDLGRPAAA